MNGEIVMLEGQPLVVLLAATLISFFLFLLALVKIAQSPMSDAVKLGWVLTILFLPLVGSFCALVVVRKY